MCLNVTSFPTNLVKLWTERFGLTDTRYKWYMFTFWLVLILILLVFSSIGNGSFVYMYICCVNLSLSKMVSLYILKNMLTLSIGVLDTDMLPLLSCLTHTLATHSSSIVDLFNYVATFWVDCVSRREASLIERRLRQPNLCWGGFWRSLYNFFFFCCCMCVWKRWVPIEYSPHSWRNKRRSV